MTDPIEIMARAIVDARGEHPEGSQHHFVDGEMHSATFLQIADHNARAANAALTEAGYAIVPVSPSEEMTAIGGNVSEDADSIDAAQIYRAMIEAAPDYIMPPPMQDAGPLESMEAREPYKAPYPIEGETHGDYIMRMAESFEQWANRK